MRQKCSLNVCVMIQTTECKPSAAMLWSLSWQTMLWGDLTVHASLISEPCTCAAIQWQRRHAMQCEHADCEWWVFWPSHWRTCLWLHFILSPLIPSHYLVISESMCSQYLLKDFFNKPLIKHTDTDTQKYCCHSTHTEVFAKGRDTKSCQHRHTHTHSTSTCMLLPRLEVAKATAVRHPSF